MNIEQAFSELETIKDKITKPGVSFDQKVQLVSDSLQQIKKLRDALSVAEPIAAKMLNEDLTLTPFK